MAGITRKVVNTLIFLTIVSLIGLAVFCGVWWMEWPLWVGAFILAGIVGIYLLIKLIRKLYRRRKERRFVTDVSTDDSRRAETLPSEEKTRAREMQAKWKQAVDTLRKSHLKTMGNPLYVLPWYMITGNSASGKTTAIKSARLSSPFEDACSIGGISGTRNCDWWFFERAIIIDTAGRYSVHQDPAGDIDEWQKFLALLVKYRKKEPLNGLIVTVTADELQKPNRDTQESYGKNMRTRIDELMRVLGSKFPVYVMVTKCDKVQGMTQFCEQLPDSCLEQTMGSVKTDPEEDPATFVTRAFTSLGDQLRDLILLALHAAGNRAVDPELILLPGEFENLRSGFRAFIRGLLQNTPYQETPIFRGIFFSSGHQEGSPYSHFLEKIGAFRDGGKALPETDRGLFLHDFFARILPADRGLFTITQRMVEWRKITRTMGFAAWVALTISVCGLLSFSFVKNLQVLKDVSLEFKGNRLMQEELLTDISTLERFSQTINGVEERNNTWWFPRMGLTQSIHLEQRLKIKYCSLMKSRFLDPFDKQMADRLAFFSLATPTRDTINHINHLVKRINLINARLDREDFDTLNERSQPYYAAIETGAGQSLIYEIRSKLKDMYLHYLYWHDDEHELEKKRQDLQRWLKRILSVEGATLNWLAAWANMEPDLNAYTLSDFWGELPGRMETAGVDPAWTLAGKERIEAFIREIETALPDPLLVAGMKRNFSTWLAAGVIKAWHEFVTVFPTGRSLVTTKEDWRALVDVVYLDKGPYFSFLNVLQDELKRFKDVENLPAWLRFVFDFEEVQSQATLVKTQEAADSGILKRTASRVTSRFRIGRAASRLKRNFDADAALDAGRALFDYQQALNDTVPSLVSEKAAFTAASAIYGDDSATSSEPFYKAVRALEKLKRIMGAFRTDEQAFWDIAAGPIDSFHEYIIRQTSCHLQKLWEDQVLLEIKDVADKRNINALLLGSDGYAVAYVKGPAGPFIGRGLKKGFYAKSVENKTIPFSREFLSFLTKGLVTAKPVKDSYKLSIEAFPTDVNENALVKPHATIIEIHCSKEATFIENYNYPIRKTVEWSPDEPCTVTFSILIEDLVLKRDFSSPNALPKFLKLFNDGLKKFNPSDFPDHSDALKRRNINYIKVKYNFKGHVPLLSLLRATPGSVPQEVVTCWD